MKLKPLYTIRYSYPEGWDVKLKTPEGTETPEELDFYFAKGRVEGVINGVFRGANHPHRRVDKNFEMNMQGLIQTDDGAVIMTSYRGYGRSHRTTDREGRRQVVGAAWHLADSQRYIWLNECVCAIAGEVRVPPVPPDKLRQADVNLVFDVAEIIWEPPTE